MPEQHLEPLLIGQGLQEFLLLFRDFVRAVAHFKGNRSPGSIHIAHPTSA